MCYEGMLKTNIASKEVWTGYVQIWKPSETWGCHNGECEDYNLLGRDAMYSGWKELDYMASHPTRQ
jgi:hypothetical protein